MTFLLLQIVNAILAAASLGIHFLLPTLWDDQAIVFSTLAGSLLASLTAVALGISMLLAGESKSRGTLVHLVLTLGFAGLQGWLLFLTGRDLGIIHMIKSRLG